LEAVYGYTDEQGTLLYEVHRLRLATGGKSFRQRQPDGMGGWLPHTRGVRRVLFNLPAVLKAVAEKRAVILVEGEKAAAALIEIGLTATTNVNGAGRWSDTYSESLRLGRVVVLPDADAPGQQHAQDVAKSLYGIASEIYVVQLPDLLPAGDAADWLKVSGNNAEQLKRIVWAAPVWSPALALEDEIKAYLRQHPDSCWHDLQNKHNVQGSHKNKYAALQRLIAKGEVEREYDSRRNRRRLNVVENGPFSAPEPVVPDPPKTPSGTTADSAVPRCSNKHLAGIPFPPLKGVCVHTPAHDARDTHTHTPAREEEPAVPVPETSPEPEQAIPERVPAAEPWSPPMRPHGAAAGPVPVFTYSPERPWQPEPVPALQPLPQPNPAPAVEYDAWLTPADFLRLWDFAEIYTPGRSGPEPQPTGGPLPMPNPDLQPGEFERWAIQHENLPLRAPFVLPMVKAAFNPSLEELN
jgi:hypothetical protein